ncbi:MAG: YdjY domain-containing protein, partial [Planctomycetota bacterium]
FLPGISIDPAKNLVVFEAEIAIDAMHPDTPVVYLELVACTPDTREHESLVVTRVRPSNIHAALLAIGAEPGAPGGFAWQEGAAAHIPASGEPIAVWLGADGRPIVPPEAWVVSREAGEPWKPGGFVFAGSLIRDRQGATVYDADGTGVVIGLATFGSEVIAPVTSFSPDASVTAPEWIADRAMIPPRGTPVKVVLEVRTAKQPSPG